MTSQKPLFSTYSGVCGGWLACGKGLVFGVWGAMEQKVHLSPTSVGQYLLPSHPVIFRSRSHD